MPPIRVIFFGTAELACSSLAALADHPDIHLSAVVSQPDRPKGRELRLEPPPVKIAALKRGLTVLQPERARRPEFIQEIAALHPDLIIVAAYGQILPAGLLEMPRHGALNVHTSLLPRYRGAAPIQWAILNDDPETGVTIMKMDAGLDTGDILTQRSIPIEPSDNAQTLHDKLAALGASLLLETIPDWVAGKIQPRKQQDGSTYARKITKEDGQLDWTLPARALWNRVRAFTPWPGAWTFLPSESGKALLKIWDAQPEAPPTGRPGEIVSIDKTGVVVACGQGGLRITRLQRESGRPLAAGEFLAGHRLCPGQLLGLGNRSENGAA